VVTLVLSRIYLRHSRLMLPIPLWFRATTYRASSVSVLSGYEARAAPSGCARSPQSTPMKPRTNRRARLYVLVAPGRIWRICGLACVTIIVVALGCACSGASQSTVVAEGYGPVSGTNNPACLLNPDQIKAVLGSASGPSPGRVKVISGYACFYDQVMTRGVALAVYSFPGMSEQAFQEDRFPIPGMFLSVPVSAPVLYRVKVNILGDESFLWNENVQAASAVEFRRGGNVVVIFLSAPLSSMGNSSRAAAAISLARDAASATVS
jgi:hypothetical protein